MANNKNKWGFIALWRKSKDHWLWEKKRSRTKFEAWIDLLWLASHEPQKKLINNRLVILETGQRDLSYRFLATRWLWSKNKVIRFIKMLENDSMVDTDSDTGQTIITICNYETYQRGWKKTNTDSNTQTNTQANTRSTQARVQREELIRTTNNYKEKENLSISDEGINQDKKDYSIPDHLWCMRIYKNVASKFNLSVDSYNGYIGLIQLAYQRIGKDRVELGVKNFLNDKESGMKNITYFFKTGIDSYLVIKNMISDKEIKDRIKRIKDTMI